MLKSNLILILFFIQFSFYGQNNNCTILETIDTIKINNIKVKRGDVFSENDTPNFSTLAGAIKCRCLNPLRIKSVFAKNYEKSKAKTLKEYWHNLGTRNNSRLKIKDWDSFKSSKKTGIINELLIPLDFRFKSIIKDTINYAFFVRYYKEGKKIEKEIPFENWTLKITKDLFKYKNSYVNIKELTMPLPIYLYSKKGEGSTKINSNFNPVFIDEKKLKKELSSILNSSDFQKIDKVMMIKEYLTLNYPNTNFSINVINQIITE